MTTETQPNEKIIGKIRHALSLANAEDDHESQTAMLLAQQMMAKYGIAMADIDDASLDADKEVVEMYATKPGTLYWWQKSLSKIVADNFRCFTYYRTRDRKSRILFLGEKEDAKIAREVMLYAQQSIEILSISYLDNNGIEGMSNRTAVRNDYIVGFLNGLRERFKEQVKQNDWGLVVVAGEEVVQKYEQMNIVKGSSSSVNRSNNPEAIAAGYDDGKSMDTNNKTLKN